MTREATHFQVFEDDVLVRAYSSSLRMVAQSNQEEWVIQEEEEHQKEQKDEHED